jgi:hypothetical protein
VARDLLRDWDEGVAVVADEAAREARVLRVGTLTSIGRALHPAIIDRFASVSWAGRSSCGRSGGGTRPGAAGSGLRRGVRLAAG